MLKKLIRKIKRWLMNLYYQLQGYPPFQDFDVENEDDDEIMYCQDCGCMIEWDLKGGGDDILRPAYVTASGDLFCSRCGREYDEAEEDAGAEGLDFDPYEGGWVDPALEDELEAEEEETMSEPEMIYPDDEKDNWEDEE